ncbi:14291_t:CDS:2 [Ambispora leptoticha]|uniref:14291_t:CDS:1 n=1 Tax=Ambispora leptoticha TaxID=144679 RepID=A0A9N8ZKV0_9GLOM|nr:14291_t:CDS:2 [Ambispora leptoticha]
MNIQLTDAQHTILVEDRRQKLKLLFKAISIGKNQFSFEVKDDILEKDEIDSELEDEIFFLIRLNAPFLSDLKVDSTTSCTIKYRWEYDDIPEILESAIYCHRKINDYYDGENTINIPQEILDRDAEKRESWRLYKSTFNNHCEARWQEKFFEDTEKYLPGFHFLYDFQWEPVPGHNDFGENDLILTDGCGCFAVVEVKFISSSNSEERISDKLHKVNEQAKKYRDLFIKANRDNIDLNVLTVIGVTFTNQEDGTVGFVDDFDESIADAIKYNRRLNRSSPSPIDTTVNNPNLTFEDGRLKYSSTYLEKRAEIRSEALRKSNIKTSADGENLCDWDREMKQEISRLEAKIQKQSERERELNISHVNEIEEIQQRNDRRFEKVEKRRNKLQDEIQRQDELIKRLQEEKESTKKILVRKIEQLQQKIEEVQGKQYDDTKSKLSMSSISSTSTPTSSIICNQSDDDEQEQQEEVETPAQIHCNQQIRFYDELYDSE